MSTNRAGAVIHRNVAVIVCDTAATLAETMSRLAELSLDAVCIGDRYVVMPAPQAETVLAKLREFGQFPRLVGEPVVLGAEELSAVEDDA